MEFDSDVAKRLWEVSENMVGLNNDTNETM
jgi:hypothetical protein